MNMGVFWVVRFQHEVERQKLPDYAAQQPRRQKSVFGHCRLLTKLPPLVSDVDPEIVTILQPDRLTAYP